MSWVTIVWSMIASACLTLAMIHLLIWCKNRTARSSLAFALVATAVAGVVAGELSIMRARTPGDIATAIRWTNVPVCVMVVCLIWIVQLNLCNARPWLGWLAAAMRFAALILNFATGATIQHREVISVRQIDFLGEPVSVVAEAVINPWVAVPELSNVVMVLFVVDASIRQWRAGGHENRRRALQVGGSILCFILMAATFGTLVNHQVIQAPYLISVPFLAIVLVMNLEISREVLRAAALSSDLRESEERMTLAAEAAGFGVWVWNITADRVWGSERWLRIFGFDRSEGIGLEDAIQRIHPADRETVRRDLMHAVSGDAGYVGEFRVVLPDGTQRWVASRGRIQPVANGKPSRMLGAALDTTARKQADERFRLVVESSPNGIVLVSGDGRIVLVNAQTEALFGYSRGELIGEALEKLVPEAVRARHRSHVSEFFDLPQRRAMASGRELNARRKDGTEFPVEIGLSPIQSEQEILVLAAIVDITTRKKAELAMRGLSRRLIRAHEEERARLARELHDDLTQRLARLAIDATQVEKGATGSPVAEVMRSIRDDLVRLSEDVHALSYRLHPSVLEDLGLAEALKAECERFSHQESITIDVRLRDVPVVVPPETALCLFRVAQEALRNVSRHAKARKVKLTLHPLNGGLQMAIMDDGIGFEPDLHRERASLGLASMRERAVLVGGELDVESKPGEGTTVLVTVPLTGINHEP